MPIPIPILILNKLTKNGLNNVPEELFDHQEIVVDYLKKMKLLK